MEAEGNNALLIKMFIALAFVPIALLPDAFNSLVDSLDDEQDQHLAAFLIYFQTTFPTVLWNVNGRVIDNLPRTNNSVEGRHNAFNTRVGIKHPSPKHFS